ncbi:MAG: ABC transporter permease, partial [Gammaproteobacteria bacterium]
LDLGQFAAGFLGLGLLLAAFVAVGLFLSSVTDHPTVAGIASFGALLLLWIIEWPGGSEEGTGLFAYLSMVRHFQSLLKGVFNSVDVFYYLLLIAVFLILTVWRLDADRLQH